MIELDRLERIDWDFPRAGNTLGSVHGVHWFPGNFIAQIPSTLIQILSKPGDLVLDPFAGSATTAVEAQKLGRRSIISDRMSMALIIAEAKLALLQGGFSKRERGKILSLLTFEHKCVSDAHGQGGEGSDLLLNDWYAPKTLSQLRYLWSIIEAQPNIPRKILTAIFSDVLFNCASTAGSQTQTGKLRRHHWGWVADNVRPKELVEHNAIRLFSNRLAAIDTIEVISCPVASHVLQQDARRLALSDDSIDLVVTSPPYIGVIDYTSANRLSYAWMGWSMQKERDDEIGARYRRGRKSAVPEYLAQMTLVRDELFRVLKPKSFCAIVIGASRKFPHAVDAVLASYEERMPITWGPKLRAPTRRRVSDREANGAVEYVCVFRKP